MEQHSAWNGQVNNGIIIIILACTANSLKLAVAISLPCQLRKMRENLMLMYNYGKGCHQH